MRGETVGERELVPILDEDEHSEDGFEFGVAGAGLETDGDVATTGVDEPGWHCTWVNS